MLIVADCHARDEASEEFRQFLRHIDGGKQPIVFLGDIFDLWIALPQYEKSIHRYFLDWCRHQRCEVGWVDGNREYFVASVYRESFAWATDSGIVRDHVHFCHGDLINAKETTYRIFRRIARSGGMYATFRMLPFGPKCAMLAKRMMKRTNAKCRQSLPLDSLRDHAEKVLRDNVNLAVTGHFHQSRRFEYGQKSSVILAPPWCDAGHVLLINGTTDSTTLAWRDVTPSEMR